MKDSKLIEILKTLSPEEFKELEKFTASPFFSVGRDLNPFLRILKSFYPEFKDKNLNIDYIFARLYPGKAKGNAQQLIKTLSSDTIKICKEFFRQIEFRNDFNRRNYYLANQLRLRKLYRDYDKEYRMATEEKNRHDSGGTNDFIERYFLGKLQKDYSLDRDDFVSSFENSLAACENLLAAGLMNSFLIEDEKNIALGYNLNVRYNLMDTLLANLDADKMIKTMEENEDRFYPYMVIFYLIYKMNKDKSGREYYYRVKELLKKSKELFGQTENYTFWNILMSYCSIRRADEELVDIYKYIFRNNIYRKSDKEDFHVILYRNIVTRSALLGETKWLEEFIEKYTSELHIKHRENMKLFSNAFLNFSKKNFERSLEFISQIDLDIFIFKMDARILMLELFYELSYNEQSYSLIDSTSHYLKDTKDFSESIKAVCRNFLKNYRELLRLRSSAAGANEVEQFEKKITEDPMTIQLMWLKQKSAELKLQSGK